MEDQQTHSKKKKAKERNRHRQFDLTALIHFWLVGKAKTIINGIISGINVLICQRSLLQHNIYSLFANKPSSHHLLTPYFTLFYLFWEKYISSLRSLKFPSIFIFCAKVAVACQSLLQQHNYAVRVEMLHSFVLCRIWKSIWYIFSCMKGKSHHSHTITNMKKKKKKKKK